jgi:hypothetical protein
MVLKTFGDGRKPDNKKSQFSAPILPFAIQVLADTARHAQQGERNR